MHDVGVILAREDETGTAQVRGQLIDLVERLIDDVPAVHRIAEIRDHEVVGRRRREFGIFQVNAPDPEPLALEGLNEMRADKSARAAYDRFLHAVSVRPGINKGL